MQIKIFFVLILLCISRQMWGQTVVTYVTQIQEERRSTRWTLTEWLRIKERMKLMDLWREMFSNPEKDRFNPELDLSYSQTRGILSQSQGSSIGETTNQSEIQARQVGAQLWLTNLLTQSTGVRMVNIDFGIEGNARETNRYLIVGDEQESHLRNDQTTAFSGNFRLFGKNIQDTSLVVKAGQYKRQSKESNEDGAITNIFWQGLTYGVDLQMYLLRSLGLEGHYREYGRGISETRSSTVSGSYYDYLAFIEVSLLRIIGGFYQEEWNEIEGGEKDVFKEKGILTGLKLQF